MLRIEKYQAALIVFILYLDIFRTKFINFFTQQSLRRNIYWGILRARPSTGKEQLTEG
jgi:hypothetical protein